MEFHQEGNQSVSTMQTSGDITNKIYAIVGFSNEDSIEVIPSSWIVSKTEAKWPPETCSVTSIKKWILKCELPHLDWNVFKIRIFSFSNSFKTATAKAETLRLTSAVSSNSSEEDDSPKRKRQKPSRFLSSDESSVEENYRIPSKKYPTPTFPSNDKSKEVQKEMNTSYSSQSEASNVQERQAEAGYSMYQRIFKYFEKMNAELKLLNKKIDNLAEKSLYNNSYEDLTEFLEPEEVKLPLSTEDELIEFNNKLQNKDFASRMVRYFHKVSYGKSPRNLIDSITKKMLSQDLAQQYSRCGRKGKKSFSKFNYVMNVILAVAALSFKEQTKENLADIFGKVLACSGEWSGRKARPSDTISQGNEEAC